MPATYSLPSWELCDTVAWVGAYNQRDPLRFLYAVVGLSIDVKRENWSISFDQRGMESFRRLFSSRQPWASGQLFFTRRLAGPRYITPTKV